MKQNIIIGNAVDDGTGDYMRRGGEKINNNFQELYSELGDGLVPHAAGYWKRYSNPAVPLTISFGAAYTIDTTRGPVDVKLPAGKPSDYGRVIRLRDVNGSWAVNAVRLIPGGSDTIKGSNTSHKLWRNYLDAELVYCTPGKWEYADNKLVTGITSSDLSTVAKKEIIATAGQTDFTDIFSSSYNPGALEVYRRGNLLYYGDKINEDSDYGSMTNRTPVPADISITSAGGTNGYVGYWAGLFGSITKSVLESTTIIKFAAEKTTNSIRVKFTAGIKPMDADVIFIVVDALNKVFLQYDESTQEYIGNDAGLATNLKSATAQTYKFSVYKLDTLDGKTIRLNEPCDSGDVITIVSYLDGLATYRSSYQRYTIRMYDAKLAPTNISTIAGQRWVGDLPNKVRFSLDEFDLLERETFNPFSFEVTVNGRHLTKAGDADLPAFICEGAEASDEVSCISLGGAWVQSGGDFSVVTDLNDRWREFIINEELHHEDIVCIRWFNNDIGTTLDWDGDGGIQEKADARYLVSEQLVSRVDKIKYVDPNAPSATTARDDPDDEIKVRIHDVNSMMTSMYPVGSIYMNANNPNNPRSYMGFGEWRRFGEGKVLVSWNESNPNDPNFGLNNNDKDLNGIPRHSAGGTGGAVGTTILKTNIPPLVSNEKALIADPVGDVLIGGCQFDPDDDGPGFKRYREDQVKFRPGEVASAMNNLQPFITVNIWVRVL